MLTGDEVDLDAAARACTPGRTDGGSFFNLGLTHTKHPETGIRNLGLYRLQRHDKRTIGMHWQIHKDSPQPLRGGRQRAASGCRSRSPSAARPS